MTKFLNVNQLIYNKIKSPRFLSIVKGDNSKNFSRKRKVGPKDIMSYLLNEKGISQKMEMEFSNEITGFNISFPECPNNEKNLIQKRLCT